MPCFTTTPPSDPLPRADAETLPPKAQLPENVGPPDGLPAIPVIEAHAGFPPEDLPDEAEEGLMHAPWA